MKLSHSIGISLAAAALLAGCKERSTESPRSASAPNTETVTPVRPSEEAVRLSGSLEVSVGSQEQMFPPEGSVLRVTLSDVSKADAPAEVIAEQILTIKGGPPFVVTLTYDPAKIQNRSRYAVSARIQNGDRLLFTTDASSQVLTGGAPKSRVDVVARAVPAGQGGG